jgi:hypothetical protein
MRSRWLQFIGVAMVSLAVMALPAVSGARAQGKKVEADYKGAVGLGLVGAELGAVIPALAGVDATWAYIVFPAVGAAGGAVAGYFAIDNAGHAELSVAALTVGMALVIPALVVTLWATAYDPDDSPNATRSGGPGLASRGHLPRPRLSAQAQRRVSLASAGAGMLRLADGELALATPGLALVPSVQRGEMRLAGVNVSLLSGRF